MKADDEPTIAVGHLSLRVTDVHRSAAFYLSLGMREHHPRSDGLAILELRGGTHLLLFRSRTKPRPKGLPFDFIVDDLVGLQERLRAAGHPAGPIVKVDRFSPHRTFTCKDPDGHGLTFTSDHDGPDPIR
jgi:catechol 2,3-dioxygenase-like lactoylglutathione lyase family enzyme